jgi:hypothetical protein
MVGRLEKSTDSIILAFFLVVASKQIFPHLQTAKLDKKLQFSKRAR